MDAQIVQRPAFSVIGMVYRGPADQNEFHDLWVRFWPRYDELQNIIEPEICYGVCDHFNEQTGEFDYLACMQVAPTTPAPTGMEKWDIPDHTYAVFPVTLPTIGSFYTAVYQEWLPQSGYHRVDGPDFELYPADFDPNRPDSTFYMYIPVEKA